MKTWVDMIIGFVFGCAFWFILVPNICRSDSDKIQEQSDKIKALQIECNALHGYKKVVEEYYDKQNDTLIHKHCLKNFY